MFVGVAGSGKTTLSHAVAERICDGVLLSKDTLQDPFTKDARGGDSLYEFVRGPTFDILIHFADLQLSLGKTPIIEGPFSKNFQLNDRFRDWPAHFREIARKRGTKLLIFRCLPPGENVLKDRLKERGFARDKGKLERWDEWKHFEPMDFPIPHDHVFDIMTDRPLGELVDIVIKRIVHSNG